MIRFCDSEIYRVDFETLNRDELLNYFFMGNMNEIVYVLDVKGKYRGKISYNSLLFCSDVYTAISKDFVVLDNDIWKNARKYFWKKKGKKDEMMDLLPVVNRVGELVSFAYYDPDGDRELRLIRELEEEPYILHFSDLYPKVKCVKIYEFNELAYFFVKYLKNHKIDVQMIGAMWEGFFECDECQIPEYACLKIFAEGTGRNNENWRANLLKGVSVEFECINKIYEMNLRKRNIMNTKCDCISLFEYLKQKEIIVLGSGCKAQDTYDFFLKNGIDICCFAIEGKNNSHRLFGKSVLDIWQAVKTYKDAVLVNCIEEKSSWGGATDYYDCMGYKRNEKFFLLKDYVSIPEINLINVLKEKRTVLLGDIYLCNRLSSFLKLNNIFVEGYLDIDLKENVLYDQSYGTLMSIDDQTVVLIVVPESFSPGRWQEQEEKKQKLIALLIENGLNNYTDYFSYMTSFITIEERTKVKYPRKQLRPKRIVLGSIEAYSGNLFFDGLLDNHPDILIIDFCSLRNCLFWICIRLSVESADNILNLFWKIYREEKIEDMDNPSAFNEKMEQMLEYGNRYTSQELFVMIHVAFMYNCGKNITEEQLNNMIIFWEPHFMERQLLEDCARWLGAEEMPCDIINIVRNVCMTKGCAVKQMLSRGLLVEKWRNDKMAVYNAALSYPTIDKNKFKWGDRLVIKFEDLKLDPFHVLSEICDKWQIKFRDSLMETTCRGEKYIYHNGEREIKDFDLKPVYDTYEKYFSVFDRFRIILINAPWQRKYGYPYEKISQFSRKELQDIFLKKFRFDEMLEQNKCTLMVDINIQNYIRMNLQRVRMLELFSEDTYSSEDY